MNVPRWANQELSESLAGILEAGESDAVEFKQEIPQNNSRLAKEIAAMATSGKGMIILGVDDAGTLIGLKDAMDDDVRDELHERVHGIARSVKPIPAVEYYWVVDDSKAALILSFPETQKHPVYYADGVPYIRDQRRSRRAEPEEVQEEVWKHPSAEHAKRMQELEYESEKAHRESMASLSKAHLDRARGRTYPTRLT